MSSVSRVLQATLLLASSTTTALGNAPHFQADPLAAQRLEDGKKQLDQVNSDPAARTCWAGAVRALEAGCRGMHDGQRSRLAVKVRRTPNINRNQFARAA
jgi:hypothetical protein